MQPDTRSPRSGGAARWLDQWEPEDETFWETKGKSIAWNALTITTANLTMAFAVWFVVSALVVRLEKVGYDFSTTQLFWLAAMPGLAGGTLRILGNATAATTTKTVSTASFCGSSEPLRASRTSSRVAT